MKNILKHEVLAALREYALDMIPDENLVTLPSFSNHVWKVKSKNQIYVLRRYSKIPYEDLVCMNSNIVTLINLGIPIPHFIRNLDGAYATCISEHGYDLSEFIPHVELKYPDMNITNKQIKQAAALLAKIHNIPFTQLPYPIPDKSANELNFNYTLKLIDEFQSIFQKLLISATQDEKVKLYNLYELIKLTDDNRREFIDKEAFSLEHCPKVLSQGDFSLSNLLPASLDKKMYIVDWENMGLRTRAWELHRSLLLICGKGYCNANFDELDFKRATIFLNFYKSQVDLSFEEISLLPRIAEYIAFFHWTRFTLESVLREDNRILERIPHKIEEGLWWKTNSKIYTNWIQKYLE